MKKSELKKIIREEINEAWDHEQGEREHYAQGDKFANKVKELKYIVDSLEMSTLLSNYPHVRKDIKGTLQSLNHNVKVLWEKVRNLRLPRD